MESSDEFPLPQHAAELLDRAAVKGRRLLIRAVPAFGIAELVQEWAARAGDRSIPVYHYHHPEIDGLPAWLDGLPEGPAIVSVEIVGEHAHADGWVSVAAGDMTFLDIEVAALVADALGASSRDIDPRDIAYVAAQTWEMTGGWPDLVAAAAQVLRLRAMRAAAFDRALLTELVEGAVRKRLTHELLPAVPSSWLPMLRYLAVCGEATAFELAESGLSHGGRHVAPAAELGVITAQGRGDDLLVRLQPVLARLIANDLRTRMPGELHDVRTRIVSVRYAHGILDCGITAALAEKDWAMCAEVLERWKMERLLIGPYRDIAQQALAAIPRSYYASHRCLAHLAEMFAIVPLGSIDVQVPQGHTAIHAAFGRDGGAEALRTSVVALAARRYWGRMAEARSIALQAEAQADLVIDRNTPSAGMMPYWYLHAGMACQLAGDDLSAQRMYESGWRGRTWDTTGFAVKDLAAKHAVLRAFRGERTIAENLISEALQLPECGDWVDKTIASSIAIAEAALAFDDLDDERVRHFLEGVDTMISREELWPYRVWMQARFELHNSNPLGVLHLVDHARHKYSGSAKSPGLHAPLLDMLLCEARLALGHGTNARALLHKIDDSFAPAWPTRIRFHLLTGDIDAAAALASELAARTIASPRVATEVAVLNAAALLLAGENAGAGTAARRASSLIQRWKLPAALLGLPSGLPSRLAELAPSLRQYLPSAAAVRTTGSATIKVVTLTQRETLILQGLAAGLTRKALAEKLFVSLNTIKTQVSSLYAKLGANSRETALARAGELGLLPG